jgi:hypothetical protein
MSVGEESNSIVSGPVTRREVLGKTVTAATLAAGLEAATTSGDPVQATSVFRIHPAIGIARMGNADPSTFFIGPEVPGYGPLGEAPGTAAIQYKVNGLIKPQAARFRVFEYRLQDGAWTPHQEVTLATPGVSAIQWTVHLANRKASFHQFAGPAGESTPSAGFRNATVTNRQSLDIDFGARSISGASQPPVSFQAPAAAPYPLTCPLNYQGQPVINYLGQLRTDGSGRLVVIGGMGKAGFQTSTPPDLKTYANNDGWFDDASDGPVTSTVTVQTNPGQATTVPVDAAGGAWVLCAPPDFAPRVRAAVTMYDLLYDLGVRLIPIPANNGLYNAGGPLATMAALKKDYKAGANYEFPTTIPDFNGDIFPILKAAYEYYWVTELVTVKHASLMDPSLGTMGAAALANRQFVFQYLRPPAGINSPTGKRDMPHLQGDDPYLASAPDAVQKLAITHVQFGLMRRWADGNFVAATPGTPPNPPALPPPVITAAGLDQAALENCVGGAFFPGIESGWQIRNPNLYAEPFRLNLQAASQYLNSSGVPEGGMIAAGHFSD